MFPLYRLFHHCIRSAPLGSSNPTPQESPFPLDPTKDRAVAVWFTIFGLSLFFRPVAEFVVRILFFSACVFLFSALDGSLNLLVGHAVLRSAKYKGYDPSLLSSVEAGSLGGIIVIGPSTLAAVFLDALLGAPKIQSALSAHAMLLLELASVIAASTAACSLGSTLARRWHPEDGQPLDTARAARAGALGACILTVPILSTAAFLMCRAQRPSARNGPVAPPPPPLTDDLVYPGTSSLGARPRRYVVAHTAAETVGYVLVTLCILTVRLLCF